MGRKTGRFYFHGHNNTELWLCVDIERKTTSQGDTQGVYLGVLVSIRDLYGRVVLTIRKRQKHKWNLTTKEVKAFMADEWKPFKEIAWTWQHSGRHGKKARLALPLSWTQVMEYSLILGHDLSQIKGIGQ